MPNSNLPPQPIRFPWGVFPPVWIHADETAVKKHRAYNVAKAGDPDAAYQLVTETRSLDIVEQLIVAFSGMNPILVSAHAVERAGVNAIPEALADIISKQAGWRADASIVQTNIEYRCAYGRRWIFPPGAASRIWRRCRAGAKLCPGR